MSYARPSQDCDIYLYPTDGHYVLCFGCQRALLNSAQVVEHMHMHKAYGDKVPDKLMDPHLYDDDPIRAFDKMQ